jgi:hypothetical protein
LTFPKDRASLIRSAFFLGAAHDTVLIGIALAEIAEIRRGFCSANAERPDASKTTAGNTGNTGNSF